MSGAARALSAPLMRPRRAAAPGYGAGVNLRTSGVLSDDQAHAVQQVRDAIEECARAEAALRAAREQRDAVVREQRAHVAAVGWRRFERELDGAISDSTLRAIATSAPPLESTET